MEARRVERQGEVRGRDREATRPAQRIADANLSLTLTMRQATDPVTLLHLQRAAGNEAVTELLNSRHRVPEDWRLSLAGVSNAGLAPSACSLQRDAAPGSSLASAPQPQKPFDLRLPEPPIEGPLPPATTLQSRGLTVKQVDAQHAEIEYGESWVRIAADPGDTYAFSVGPPIEEPPKPQLGPLITLPDPDAKPELPQRLVRVTATRPIVEQRIEQNTRVAPLAVQTRYVGPREIAEMGTGLMGAFEVIQTMDDEHAQLQLEDSIIRIEVAPNAAEVAGEAKRARFAYWIDPEWTGPEATEKRVVIVAAPGVAVRTGSPAHAPVITYGRKLVEEVVRVPHPNLVPKQGTRFSVEQFVQIDVVDSDKPPPGPFPNISGLDQGQHRNEVDIATGLAGVVVVHPWSGSRLTLKPTKPEIGAAYAWQVLPPLNGAPGEIRAVVGQGVDVELEEPVPYHLRDHKGNATPTPKKGQAHPGEGLEEETFELKLVEVPDPGQVPQQGVPLNIEHFLQLGGRIRDPDRHRWLGTNDLPFMLASSGIDLIIGMIPIVGQLYLIGEFAYTMATGHDWWGNEVDDAGKVMMGFGAAISLIPLVGGLGALLRGGAKAAVIAEFAARWGTTVEELQAVLVRVGAAVEGDEAVVVQRAMRAIEKGEHFAEEDLPVLQRVLAKVGAGHLGIEGIARTGIGRLDIALAAAGEPLRSENYLANLVSAYRTTGEIPESLATPLARSGQFGTAEEAEAAIQQALRDLARAEGVAADESMIAKVAARAGTAMGDVQAAGTLEIELQIRELAVSQPQLVADYERLVNEKLPAVMREVLARQGSTPPRVRLAQLRTQFDQLRAQVGDAQRLTNAQRDDANRILRAARDASEADFNNVRDAVWRRLRNLRRNPDLAAIEQQLRAAGDVQGPRSGALRVRMASPEGETSFESMNLEHRVRRSDNPWLYNSPENLIASDAAQNQQYLESLRQQGSIWPSGAVEEFVVRHGLNDQGINFQPHSR
jgi:hypothetical protein